MGANTLRKIVVHETGFFQGRLGFTRAVVVLETGCAEFRIFQGSFRYVSAQDR